MGMNSRDMRMAMKRMGIQQQEIDAEEVIIRLKDREIIISNPQVSKVNMMGQQTYQVIGQESERSRGGEPEIGEEDIRTVAESANVSLDEAEAAIKKHKGDLAAAIMGLKG
jgi:nascent polypeptide-associated complex subunit alpha